jgi:ureidoacrylate peracid hydrolase
MEAATETLLLPLRYYRMFPPENWEGEAVETREIRLATTAFCLVDVYGLGQHPDDPEPHAAPPLSSASSVGAEGAVIQDHIHPTLLAARQTRLPIIYVNNSAPRIALMNGRFARHEQRVTGHAIDELFAERSADDAEYHRGESRFVEISKLIAPEAGEYFVRKHVHSGFYETRLDSLLRNLGIETIVFVGFALDACLLATMLDAMYRDYDIILVRDATLACDLPHEAETLSFTNRMVTWVEMMVGWTTTSAEFITACEAVTSERAGRTSETP